MANALTAVRLLLVIPLGLLVASADPRAPMFAALLMLVAIVTDLADGPVARRTGTASAFGGTFDHTTDFFFVVSGLTGGVMLGAVPWILPVLVVTAFTQYYVDSYWLHGQRRLRGMSSAAAPAHVGTGTRSEQSPPAPRPPPLPSNTRAPSTGQPGSNARAQAPISQSATSFRLSAVSSAPRYSISSRSSRRVPSHESPVSQSHTG